jgi:Transposase IS66 family
MLEGLDLGQVQEGQARELIIRLLNLIEGLSADLREAQQENQRLRDEIARLNGEKGKPQIKPNASSGNRNYSSEREREKPKAFKPESKMPKQERLRIDREETLKVDPALLPEDAQFKGYEDAFVQELIFRTDNVLYHKEKFYSPSQQKTFLAEMPAGYQGQFGPQLKAFIWVLYFAAQVSEPKIVELLFSAEISISGAEVSNLLIKEQEPLHEEKAKIVQAGLESSPWQQTDDTGTRVNGVNEHCHILCNPLYTAFSTLEKKDRQSVIDALSNQQPRRYLFNEQAIEYLQKRQVSQSLIEQVAQLESAEVLDEEGFEQAIGEQLGALSEQHKKLIKDGARVAAYQAQAEAAVVKLLVCDDAGQSKAITEEVALCWVHDGRHYKKLMPVCEPHQKRLAEFRGHYWDYYRELLKYKENPTKEDAVRLEQRFDEVFETKTGYEALDERIAKTREKKAGLLAVLRHPEVPLHNNASELGARARVRKRAVSLGPRTAEGVRAWDTGMTIVETAKKLGVSVYEYLKDRLSGAKQMPSLAEVIREKANQLRLGASWDSNSVSPNF